MTAYDEIQLAELIGALPPAPESLLRAVRELPRTRRELEEVLPRLEADAELRGLATLDLERALERAGYEPRSDLVEALRHRLPGDGKRD